MLQSIRRGATTMVFKIIIGIFIVALVLLFALGDYVSSFTGNGGQDAVAISAPIRDIRESELNNNLFRIASQLQQLYPQGLDTPEKLRESNLLDLAQRQLVANQVRSQEVNRLGLAASQTRIEEVVKENPQFFDGDGNFNEDRFQFAVQSSGLTPEGYLQTIAEQLKSQDLARMVTVSPEALPSALTSPVIDHRFTQRTFDVVRVPASSVERVELEEEALRSYLSENSEDFQVPDLRSISALIMDVDAIAKPEDITDAAVAASFEEQRESLIVPERRTLQQIVFTSEEAANEAATKLEDVSVTLEEVADLGSGLVDLGRQSQTELAESIDEDLASAAFELDILDVTKPIRTSFGWHIVTSLNKTEGRDAVLEDHAERIRGDLAREAAITVVERLSQDADELVGEGASLDEVASSVELSVTEFDPFSLQGIGANGRRVANLPRSEDFLRDAFRTEVGETSLLGTLDNNQGYYLIQANEAFDARPQTFEEARTRLEAVAEREATLENLREFAQAQLETAEGEDKLASIADALGEPLTETDALNRVTLPRDTSVIRFLRDEAFELPMGEIALRAAGSDYAIIRPTAEIAVADQASDEGEDETGPTQVGDTFAQAIAADLNAALLQSLEAETNIKTNEAAIQRVLEQVSARLATN